MLFQAHIVWCLASLARLALGTPSFTPPTFHVAQTLDADGVHANILQTWPADRIVHSGCLANYTAEHAAISSTVYLSDEQVFVTIEPGDSFEPVHGRDECFPRPTVRKVLRSQTFWDPWVPVSNTVKSGKDGAGGYVTFEFSVTKGSSTDLG